MAELQITPSDDARAYEGSPDSNYGSAELTVVRKKTGFNDLSFFKWDLSSAPSADSINSAKIYIYVITAAANINDVETFLVSVDWSESTLTWTNRPAITGTNLATFDCTSTGWKNGDITSTVKDWINGVTNNYGVRMYPATTRDEYASIATKENTTTSYRPYLLIDYEPAGGFMLWWGFCESWQRHDKLWRNNKLHLPSDLGFSY